MKDEDMELFANETVKVIQVLGMDVIKLQLLLYNLLDVEGRLERINCSNCKEEVMRPDLPNIEKQDFCPSCGSSILGGTQTTFEDWDSGAVTDESE